MQAKSIIDKLIIFGVPNPERLKLSQIIANRIKVSPLQFYSLSQHSSSQNQIDYEMWAYPDGIQIYNEHFQILNDPQPQYSFTQPTDILTESRSSSLNYIHSQNISPFNPTTYPPDRLYSFVLTDYELNRTYCTCLSWNQKVFIKNDLIVGDESKTRAIFRAQEKKVVNQYRNNPQHFSKALPKCKISSLINNPLILDSSVTLVYIPKSMIICSKDLACFQFQRKLLTHLYFSVLIPKRGECNKEEYQIKVDEALYKMFDKMCMTNGYPLAEKTFDSQRFNEADKKEHLDKNSRSLLHIKRTKLKQFYLATFFLPNRDLDKTSVISESGCPIAARVPPKTAYSMPEYYDPYTQNQTLLPLPIDKLITLWKCLLLQKQILIFAHSQYEVIILCEFLLYLLKPIKWENIYIPFLPFHLSHHIDAIGGYLIGMSSIHMNYMIENFDLKSKVVVDMKNKTVLEEGGVDVVQLPSTIKQYLQTNLGKVMKKYESQLSCIANNPGYFSSLISFPSIKSTQPNPIPPQTSKKLLYISCTLEIQSYFFNSIIYLFNNFIPFIEKRLEGVLSFKTKDYLKIIPDESHQIFMKQITKTMVFIRLCEYHVQQHENCAWIQRTIGELFVYCHDILSQKYTTTEKDGADKGLESISAWPLEELLNVQNKYYQYQSYLWSKNLKEILNDIKTCDLYFLQETKKYERTLQLIPSIKGIQGGSVRSRIEEDADEQDSRLNIKKQMKWKRYGEKDEQDLYQEASKLMQDSKIHKYLIKYLKYLEYKSPSRIVKTVRQKASEKLEQDSGWLDWLYELVNPPFVSRVKQEKEKEFKLRRKLTELSGVFNDTINLRSLFKNMQEQQQQAFKQEIRETKKEQIQIPEEKNLIDFIQYHPEPLRISKAHSESISAVKRRRKSKG